MNKKIIFGLVLGLAVLLAAAFYFLKKPSNQTPTQAEKILIKGDSDCQQKTSLALALLRQKSPKNYEDVENYIGVIDCEPSGSGMHAQENPPRFLAGAATMNAGTIWYAGAIVHDANHSKLYHTYLAAHPGAPVPSDIWIGKTAESECIDAQYKALQDLGADAETLSYLKNSINSDYWDQPNRSW